MTGWIMLQRDFTNHWVASRDDWGMAWIRLLLSSSFESQTVRVGNDAVTLEPGELVGSERYLAEQWNWTRAKVRSFLSMLTNDHMIERIEKISLRNQPTTIIRIKNWPKYQKIKPNDNQGLIKTPPTPQPANNQPIYKDLKEPNKQTTKKLPPIPPKQASPVVDGCEFFRMSEHERGLAERYYRENNLDPDLLRFAISEVESWLNTANPKAVKARESHTHFRYLYAGWVLEKSASALQVAKRTGRPVNLRTATLAPSRAQQTQDRINRLRLENRANQQAIDITPDRTKEALPE